MAVMQPDRASAELPAGETIERLFAALESPLLNYSRRLGAEPSVAEDTVQEAFMILHAQFDRVREPRRWLYRTVHNLTLNQRRHSDKTVPFRAPAAETASASTSASSASSSVSNDTTDPAPPPDEQIARWEGIGLVRLRLESLDERSRELIRLRFNEDLSYKDISARTGLKVGHVGYLLHHALKSIAVELAKTGVVP